jgi:hypothetical protein
VSIEPTAGPPPVEQLPARPAGHRYSFEVIGNFLEFVLRAASSLRGASACLEVIKERLGLEHAPAPNTGEAWLLRVGLYELTRPQEGADDYAWLVDHCVQIGPHKCLAIVAVRLSVWLQQRGALEHQHLSVLQLKPMLTSDGVRVAQALEETAATHGEPRQIVIDGGSDLKKGVALFQAQHPRTAHVSDIAHKAALIVQRELLGDSRWNSFLLKLGRSTQCAKHTPLACLIAPAPRLKARYMNVHEQVRWGMRMLRCLESPQGLEALQLDQSAVQEKFGWLHEYRAALKEWDDLMHVVGATLEFIRLEGYHRQAAARLRAQLGEIPPPQASRTAAALIAFVTDQSKLARNQERLLGSSEVLESLFSKLKRLEGQQNKSGFTKLLLGMAASVATTTRDYLAQALSTIKTKQIWQWSEQHLGVSLPAQRHRALGCLAGTKVG